MIKKGLSFINILLITGVVFFGIKLFYVIVSARLDAATQTMAFAIDDQQMIANQSKVKAAPVMQKQFAAYQAIIDRDLFRTVKPKPSETLAPSQLEKLKKTQLNLTLWGTIVSTGGRSYAVIEDAKSKKQKLYRIGDSIQNATIKMILRQKVVLTVNGKDEILEMKDMEGQPNRLSNFAHAGGGAPGMGGPTSGDEERVSLNRSRINAALNNINDLMQQVRIRPYFENGKPNGILLSNIKSGSIFQKMGLQNGDIITGVNGHPIKSVDDALKFYNYLKLSNRAELQIKRNGETRNIFYQIN